MTNEQIKSNVDDFIINPDSPQSVTRANVGGIIKSTVDYTDQEVEVSAQALLSVYSNTMADVQLQIDEAIVGVYTDAGNWDASGGVFPTTTNTGDPIQKGDVFNVSVGGTLGGVVYSAGESFRALVDVPAQTAGNWAKLTYVSQEATTSTLGTVLKASDADVTAGAGVGMVNSTQLQDKINSLPAAPEMTIGVVTAANDNNNILQYGVNTLESASSTLRVLLPTGYVVGQYLYVNVSGTAKIRGNAANTAIINVSSTSSTNELTAKTGDVLRFIKISATNWSYEYIAPTTGNYRTFKFLLNQSGTNPPVATSIVSTLAEGTPTFNYFSTGFFSMTLTNAFTLGKTFILSGEADTTEKVRLTRISSSAITIESFGADGNPANSVIINKYVEVQVYS